MPELVPYARPADPLSSRRPHLLLSTVTPSVPQNHWCDGSFPNSSLMAVSPPYPPVPQAFLPLPRATNRAYRPAVRTRSFKIKGKEPLSPVLQGHRCSLASRKAAPTWRSDRPWDAPREVVSVHGVAAPACRPLSCCSQLHPPFHTHFLSAGLLAPTVRSWLLFGPQR